MGQENGFGFGIKRLTEALRVAIAPYATDRGGTGRGVKDLALDDDGTLLLSSTEVCFLWQKVEDQTLFAALDQFFRHGEFRDLADVIAAKA